MIIDAEKIFTFLYFQVREYPNNYSFLLPFKVLVSKYYIPTRYHCWFVIV